MDDEDATCHTIDALAEEREMSRSQSWSKSRSASHSSKATKTYTNANTSVGGYNAGTYHCGIKFHNVDVLDISYVELCNSANLQHDILDIYFESKDVRDVSFWRQNDKFSFQND